MTRAGTCGLCVILLVVAATARSEAYLKLGVSVDGRTIGLRWSARPIRYFIADRGVPGVSSTQLASAVARAFEAWERARASVESEFVGFTSAEPFDDDGIVTIGFADRPDLDRVLGSTGFVVDIFTGEIVEADIFLNSAFPWSVAAEGADDRFDVEAIALHELGHLLGLGHSMVGETEQTAGRRRVIAAGAAMFPIAFSTGVIEGRTLRPDDVAGISDVYPDADVAARTGSINGRVVRAGDGVYGAHVVVFNTRTGALVAGFTLSGDGAFDIAGLEPGPYLLRVEPLDDAAPESFFDDLSPPDTDFDVTYHRRLVVVSAGEGAGPAEIAVQPQ